MPTMKELTERGDVPPPQPKLSKEDKEAWAADGHGVRRDCGRVSP